MNLIQAELTAYLKGNLWLVQNGFLPKSHAVLCDPPYALISINKRFGKPNSAPAKFGNDGRHARLSAGFMGQKWDGFDSLEHYQAWVTEWAALLLDYVYPGAVGAFFGGTRTFHRLACGLEDAGWEVFDTVAAWCYGVGFPKSHNLGDGYGTALKPSWEPIVLARAPRNGHTYIELAQQFGSGALWIDGGRLGLVDDQLVDKYHSVRNASVRNNQIYGMDLRLRNRQNTEPNPGGRWPANGAFLHTSDCGDTCVPDCPVAELERQSGMSVSSGGRIGNAGGGAVQNIPVGQYERGDPGYGDTGGASRFFYTAKAANWEREAGLEHLEHRQIAQTGGAQNALKDGDSEYLQDSIGLNRITMRRNTHPTVKPIQLTTWIAKLLLPPPHIKRRILIPFAGVGSEMIGAHLAGWDAITGLEMTPEYIEQGRTRLAWWSQFTSYEAAENSYKSTQRDEAETERLREAGQLTLWESD